MLILAWWAADLATPLVIRLSHRIGAVDRPHTYKIHQEPTALLGGVAVYIAFAVAIFSILRFTSYEQEQDVFAIVGCGGAVLVLGIIDGIRPLWAVGKLGVLLLVTLILARFGVRIMLTGI